VVADLQRYVVAHPRAADTLDGVTNWWLSASLARSVRGDEVEDALRELIELGFIEGRRLPDGSALYVARTP
jgi:hypothetical protein